MLCANVLRIFLINDKIQYSPFAVFLFITKCHVFYASRRVPMSASPFPLRLLKRMSEPSAPAYKSTSSTIQNTEVTVKQGDITKETVSDSITQTLLYFICFEFLYLIIKSFIYALLGLQFKLFPFKFKYTFLNNGYIFKFVLYVFLYFIERLLIVYLIF